MSKALSEKIVDKCQENPKFAFALIPLGLVLMYWGITDAQYYRALSSRPVQIMKEVSIVSKPNDRGFTIPHVVGKAGDKEVSIPVSSKTANSMEISDQMEVIETADNSGQYVLKSSVDGQVESVLFAISEIPVNFITILGFAIAVGACGWGALAKPKAAAVVA